MCSLHQTVVNGLWAGVVPCVVRIACRSGSGYFKDEMINVTHAGTMSHNEQIVKIEFGQKNDWATSA